VSLKGDKGGAAFVDQSGTFYIPKE